MRTRQFVKSYTLSDGNRQTTFGAASAIEAAIKWAATFRKDDSDPDCLVSVTHAGDEVATFVHSKNQGVEQFTETP